MKRILLLLPSALLLLFACAKEELVDEKSMSEASGGTVPQKEYTLTIGMPATETKTVLGTKAGTSYPVYWQEGDKVTINGSLSSAVSANDNGKSEVALSAKTAAASKFNVLYPGESGVDDKVTFPNNQEYVSGSFDPNALPMWGTTSNPSQPVIMQYYASVLRMPIRFTETITMRRMTVSAVGGEPVSGQFEVGKTSGALNGSLTPYSTASSISYDFGENGTTFTSGISEFHVAIPAGTYTKGLEFKFYDTDGNYMLATAFTDNGTVAAGKVYEFATRSYMPTGTVFYISNESELRMFATKSGKKYGILEALVVNDITVSQPDNYPGTTFKYYGSLDGCDHTISGLTMPLFSECHGSVKNLTLVSNITNAVPSVGNRYGVGILARYAYLAAAGDEESDYVQTIENVTTKGSVSVSHSSEVDFSVGGMLGANTGVPMSSCVNQATVTVSSLTCAKDTTAMVFRVGGLCGATLSSPTNITGCSNTGNISVSGVVLGKSSHIFVAGGLVGYDTQDNTIENSTNSGAVTITSVTAQDDATPYLMVGGIVGDARGSSGFKLSGCENMAGGTVTIGSACQVQAARVGGIIGRVSSAEAEISGCTNRAKVEVQGATMSGSNTFGGVAGVVLGENTRMTNCKNYGEVKNAVTKLDAIGGVIGYDSKSATISGCENYGAVSSTAVPSNDHYLGGIIGKKASSMNIAFSNCRNEGNVSVTCGAHAQNIHMGGIIGGCPGGSSTFTGCSNSGNLTNSSTKSTKDGHHDGEGTEVEGTSFTPAVSIGGIIGRVTDNALGAVTGCTNSGNINNNCAATEIRLGGIVGYTHQNISDISGCTNSGTISNNVLADFCYVHEGGILGYSNAKVTMSAQNVNTGTIQSNPSTRVDICGLAEGSYDDNVRLAGCIGSYYSNTEAVLTSQKNEGEIVNKGSETCGWVYMGGLEGYAKNVKYTGALNTAYVHNEATVTSRLLIAGILGRGDADKVNDSQKQAKIQSSSRNEGNVFNNGTCAEACIGGLCAEVQQSSDISSSSNSGTIKNTGAVTNARLGGVCAYAVAYVSLDNSSNEGDVIFEGSTTEAVLIAGGIGYQKTNKNALVRNMTNTGAISCKVDVPGDLEIAGIVGDATGKVTSCTNDGPITIEGNVGGALYVGGVCGWIDTYASNPMQNCTNTVNGTISCGDITINKQIFCGGVIGGTKKSVAVTFSSLVNRGAITLGDSGISSSISKSTYSYLGGVSGGNNSDNQITYSNCENYGNIYYKGYHTFEVGGITGTATSMPTGAICKADIRYVCTNGGSSKSEVGGIAGWYKTASDGAVSGLVYDGVCNTNSSSPRAYTGGIFGAVSENHAYSFTGCKVGGQVYGVGLAADSSKSEVGLITCAESENQTINFTDCIIKTGTKRHTKVVTSLVLNHLDCGGDWTKGALCGGKSSVGTMTNCTIGSID